MTCPYKVVERNISVDARKIDKEVENKWVWDCHKRRLFIREYQKG